MGHVESIYAKPATVISSKQSFSKLKTIKIYFRFTIAIGRLISKFIFPIKNYIHTIIVFFTIIKSFVRRKARKM